ncbi:YXWGXW repeat-containing protein [Thauera butanivorans]|uniref:YXWGXW repeat-containing protein n=1 Tax=Thauera butanivorans TaxID=86174 RepID=UPI000B2038E5|nr:YXWGXW repeat-containing protein [Thauera butanivorans]
MKAPWSPTLAAMLMLLLAGCTVAPHERSYGYSGYSYGYGGYGSPYYGRGPIIVMPAPRIEHRGPPPGPGHVWIGGYWNRIGARHDWVPGYWAPPARHPRPPTHPQWQPGRDRIEHHRGDRGREPPRLRPPPKPSIDHGARPDRPRAPGFGENRRPSFEARKGERGTRAQPDFRRGKDVRDSRGRPGDRQRPSLHIDRR